MGKIQLKEYLKSTISDLDDSSKFLLVIGIISLIAICVSIFNPKLDATGHLVTIRTVFSSIVGYLLEKSTKICQTDKHLLSQKVLIVGSLGVIFTVLVIFSHIFDASVHNPSLLLVKNLLFSCVGFLIGASRSE